MQDPATTVKSRGASTLAVHAGTPAAAAGAPVVTPLISSATFHNLPGPDGEVLYGRYANTENHRLVGAKVAALEGAEAGLVVGSGMAAISLTILTFAGSGDHIVAADSLYGGTRTLLTRELPRLGIETTFVDPAGRWRDALQPNTRLLYMEVPVNPTLRVPDPRPVASLAHEHGIPFAVDATFATPINWRPIRDGVDVVVHSGTKYLGGHSDLIAGIIAGPRPVIAQAREHLKAFGPSLDPHAIWLLERGLKTLAIRVERQNATALELARWLADHPAVAAVHYPGLERHPDHAVAKEILAGFGGMLSFVVRGGDAAACRVMSRFELVAVAPSLGGVESLASMPCHTSHAALSRDQRLAAGIDDGFIRLSVGIEDLDDLRGDLERALAPEAP
ncbi:MAG TPA: aminotransferase class I/II-fold pyridoxal phosphate-dependent enzyme [Longimicrobiales bacterium]|nr:aminotransferase class I/II-fold pyridoxal phosphate-dependent enzyme [Longimicrobiales bacterium]